MIASNAHDKFEDCLQFGECANNQCIQYINIQDIDNQIIKVPFHDCHQDLNHFIDYYLQTTPHAHKFKGKKVKLFHKQTKKPYNPSKACILNVKQSFSKNQIGIDMIDQEEERQLIQQEDRQSFKPVKLVVQNISNNSVFIIVTMKSETILNIKQKIYKKTNIAVHQQRLQFNKQKDLQNQTLWNKYGIQQMNTLNLHIIDDRITIFVRLVTGKTIQIMAWPYKGIQILKSQIQDMQNIPPDQLRLIYAGKQLQDGRTLNDYQINNQSFIQQVLRLRGGGSYPTLSNILDYFMNKNQSSSQIYIHIHYQKYKICKQRLKVLYQPTFSVLQLKKHIQKLKGFQVKTQRIMFMGVSLPDDVLLGQLKWNEKYELNLVFSKQIRLRAILQKTVIVVNTHQDFRVFQLKQSIGKKVDIDPYAIKLTYNCSQLQNQFQIFKYKLQNQSLLKITLVEQEKSSKIKFLHTNTLKISIEIDKTVQLSYPLIKNKTVEQLLKQILPYYKPYYCLMFGKIILQAHHLISRIEKSLLFVTMQSQQLILLRNTQKLIFYNSLNTEVPFPIKEFEIDKQAENLRKQAQVRIKSSQVRPQYRKKDFYTPIHYYTCNKFYYAINQALKNISSFDADFFYSKEMRFVGALINSLRKLPGFIGQVYRGVRNLRFSSHQKVGDIFYWKSFTSTSKNCQIAKKFSAQSGTIFHINSLTGRDLTLYSVYKQQEEVLLLPFTYFIVEEIIRGQTSDQVWLSEMPTPLSIRKQLVIWVDDVPANNLQCVAKMQQRGIQVIQLRCTRMTMMWAQQFNWILNWMDVKYKVISDMVRQQDGEVNYEAGIDLLQLFYNTKGYSTPILIFCNNVEKAQQNVQKRKINRKQIFRITNKMEDVMAYISFK